MLPKRVKFTRSRKAGDMLSMEFADGILIMSGAKTSVSLRATPARQILLCGVNAELDSVGDAVTLGVER